MEQVPRNVECSVELTIQILNSFAVVLIIESLDPSYE